MNIIFSANNNEEVYVLPIVPPIELNIPRKNEEFETINSGTLNLIGTRGLKSLSIQLDESTLLKIEKIQKEIMYPMG